MSGIIASGGWDDTIQMWDIRAPNPIRRIFSPRICGESIDFNDAGTVLLTGSYRKESPLQLWDWESGKLIDTVTWSHDLAQPLCMVYTAQFSKNNSKDPSKQNKFIIGGGLLSLYNFLNNILGSGAVNEVKLFSTETHKVIMRSNNNFLTCFY